jgi:hypothetical protein
MSWLNRTFLFLGCLLSMNLGIWAWLYNWREKKRIRAARNDEEIESFMAHLPLVMYYFKILFD